MYFFIVLCPLICVDIQDVSGEFVFNADGLPYGGNVEIQQLYDESDSWIFPVLINMPGWIAGN